MLDPFVILAPVLLLPVVALLGFAGCELIIGPLKDRSPSLGFMHYATAAAASQGAAVQALNLNTQGCNLIVLIAADYEGATGGESVQDKSTIVDTLNPTANYQVATGATLEPNSIAIFYCPNANGGPHHDISISGRYTSLVVLWAQYADTDPVDQTQIGTANASSVTLPNFTPSGNGTLVVTGVSAVASSFTIDDPGFTVITPEASYPQSAGLAVAYQVQTTSGPVSPTWQPNAAGTIAAVIASFK